MSDIDCGSIERSWSQRAAAYGLSVVGIAASVLLASFVPSLELNPSVLFLAVVAVAAWLGGKGPAILATVLSNLVIDLFLIPPTLSLFDSIADVVRLAVFVLVAFLICYLQDNYRRVAIRLREANDVLEARVQERTADLASANESLRNEVCERQQAEAALIESEVNLRRALASVEVSLQEKVVLLRELQHRVKNNLQIISSLLSLQRSRIEDPACQELFKECQHRVRAIALVHQRLCGSPKLVSIDCAGYFEQLVHELFRSYYVGAGSVKPRVLADETSLAIDRLIPCGLIVNELACNSFKYAFPAGRSGEVCVEVHQQDGQVSLTVQDDGVGFSRTDEPRRHGVGLQIVEALVEQLSGKLEWANGRGTTATVTIPATIQ